MCAMLLLPAMLAAPAAAQPPDRPPPPAVGTVLWVQRDSFGCGSLDEWVIRANRPRDRLATEDPALATCQAIAGGTPGRVAGHASEALMTRLVVTLPGQAPRSLWFGSFVLGPSLSRPPGLPSASPLVFR